MQEVYIGTKALHVSITIASLELIPLYGRYEFNVTSVRELSSSRFTWFYHS
ncbi:32964_t:CDS:2 [Gigaspora margarita]|uniref:32964_t:CDS:1 n=1 Tax=Gigaspora margarita TaxID=4874 RepID=A0ABM8VX48_GIGMA|nr:32964_t:CDS:2 [Gigaspora margarita]